MSSEKGWVYSEIQINPLWGFGILKNDFLLLKERIREFHLVAIGISIIWELNPILRGCLSHLCMM
jgi:hypothetical protein